MSEAIAAHTYDKLSSETKEVIQKSLESVKLGEQMFPEADRSYSEEQIREIFLKIEGFDD